MVIILYILFLLSKLDMDIRVPIGFRFCPLEFCFFRFIKITLIRILKKFDPESVRILSDSDINEFGSELEFF